MQKISNYLLYTFLLIMALVVGAYETIAGTTYDWYADFIDSNANHGQGIK